MAKNYYDILGVSKTATPDEMKRAYRKLALEWHPDRNKDPQASDRFKEITKAYEVLNDPKKRQIYDQYGDAAFAPGGGFGGAQGGAQSGGYGPFTYSYSAGGSPFGGGADFGGFTDPFEIFEQFFGGGASPFSRTGRSKPRTVYRLTIDFMEAVKGVEKEVEIEGKRQKIKIPAGVDEGTRIRFTDYDVMMSVQRDSRFQREEYDLYTDATVSISQAIVGDTIDVPTIDGPLKIKVQPGTQPNTMMRLRGKGVPHIRGTGRGDQYVRIKIQIPTKVTNRQKELLAEFEEEGKKKSGWF